MEIGKVKIDFLGHSGFLISNGKRIIIDPYQTPEGIGKADIILVTHSHYDHCSVADIEKVAGEDSVVICTPSCQSKVMKVQNIRVEVVEAGDKIDLRDIKIEVVPAYNKKREFHPKSEGWVGFLIKMQKVIIYHAGDTDFINEMQKLSGYGKHGNNFVALLPVSGKTVMNAVEAAEAASLLSPDLAIPMHYGLGVVGTKEDAVKFVELCKERGIKAEILEKLK